MTTRDDVLDAIGRIERAGLAGEATKAAQVAMLMPLPPQEYDRILNQLRAEFPRLFPPSPPPGGEMPGQQGNAAQAMKMVEAALSQQQSAVAEFDRQVIGALLHAHKTTEEGRRQLDDLDAQIESAARTWDLGTAAGAREFQKYLIGKLREIVAVVQEANDDDRSKQALAAAWAALYASQTGPDGPSAPSRDGAPDSSGAAGNGGTPDPEAFPDIDPYLDVAPGEDPQPGNASVAGVPPYSAPTNPLAPAMPGFGGTTPSAGAMPAGGVPVGLPQGGLLQGLQRTPPSDRLDDELLPPGEASSGEPGEEEVDDVPVSPESAPATDPKTVRLPDGETVIAATPQLAAVMQAAADGTPIADAFRQQGIAIPPPGTAVSAPVDPSRVSPGDIGMFTDRHALAVGNSKALLDGQIQRIANVRGPSFLGWQHPPMLGETTTPTQTPTATLPSATVWT